MLSYSALMLLIAPGYIAKRISKSLGNFNISKQSEFDSLMVYFCYSLFSSLFSMEILIWIGFVPSDLSEFDYKILTQNNEQFLKVLVIVILCSILTGVIWQIFVKDAVQWILNHIYGLKHNGNEIYENYSYMAGELQDGYDHLLSIKKENQEIAFGKFSAISSEPGDSPEIALETRAIFKERFEGNRDKCSLKYTYFLINGGIRVEEYEFPPGFFDNSDGKKKTFKRFCLKKIIRLFRLLWWIGFRR